MHGKIYKAFGLSPFENGYRFVKMLQEIRPHIFAQDCLELTDFNNPCIVVHPFYRSSDWIENYKLKTLMGNDLSESSNPHLKYLWNLTNLINQSDLVVTFEEKRMINFTPSRYNKLSISTPQCFIKTKDSGIGPEDKVKKWKGGVFEFLDMFEGHIWNLAGGYFEVEKTNNHITYQGCLGALIEGMLKKKRYKFNIVEDTTFSYQDLMDFELA